jgi:hypothetical protein
MGLVTLIAQQRIECGFDPVRARFLRRLHPEDLDHGPLHAPPPNDLMTNYADGTSPAFAC